MTSQFAWAEEEEYLAFAERFDRSYLTTYIKDLIELPDHVRKSDFVLRLTEGITKPDETVATYVVTPQLVRSFDDALGLIRSALEGRTSKAARLSLRFERRSLDRSVPVIGYGFSGREATPAPEIRGGLRSAK